MTAFAPEETTTRTDRDASTAPDAAQPDATAERPFIRYVLVVHGMGEARQNETVLGVVSRFADARYQAAARRAPPGGTSEVITLGMACGQTGTCGPAGYCVASNSADGRPWLEFRGIPTTPDGTHAGPFIGEASDANGENLRFVDIHWNDLLRKAYPEVGQEPETWIAGLLGRLRRKSLAADGGPSAPPRWALEILGAIGDTLPLVRLWTKYKAAALDETIFGSFLGDVQLYGEHAQTRGAAVRRFHQIVCGVEQEHARRHPGVAARYTVIAHSLGTVMAMDALIYAHATWAAKIGTDAPADSPNLPMPGYLSNADRKRLRTDFPTGGDRRALGELCFLDTTWASRVDAFVTLGSPIDKFLLIWWLNYEHFVRLDWLTTRARKIPHFNYCELQDPVGHRLDVAQGAPAFDAIFEQRDDVVYSRHAIPGLAHVAYWRDQALFDRILRRAVDEVGGAPPAQEPAVQWFDDAVFRRGLWIMFFGVPLAFAIPNAFLFTWAYFSNSWHVGAMAAASFFGVAMVGRYVVDLIVWWRQVLASKSRIKAIIGTSTACSPAKILGAAKVAMQANQASTAPSAGHDLRSEPPEILEARTKIEQRTWHLVLTVEFGALLLCVGLVVVYLVTAPRNADHPIASAFETIRWQRLTWIVAVAVACAAAWEWLYGRPANATWQRTARAECEGMRAEQVDFALARQSRLFATGSESDSRAVGFLAVAVVIAFVVAGAWIHQQDNREKKKPPAERAQRREPHAPIDPLFTAAAAAGSISIVFGYLRRQQREIARRIAADRDEQGQLKPIDFRQYTSQAVNRSTRPPSAARP